MTEHYDVIVIGTGRVGERSPTPWRPPASGFCCSSAATSSRGRWRTGSPSRCSSTAATSRPTPGTTPTAPRSSRRSTTSSGARPSCTAPRCTGSGPQDFGEIEHVDGVSPAWPFSYDDMEPWYTKAEWLYQVHGNHGEDPTEGHWSKQYPWPPVSHEPRIQEITDSLSAAGYHPFSAPCGIMLDEADRPRSHASGARGATGIRAWSTPSPTPRPSPSAPSSTRTTSRCSSARRSCGSRPTPPAARSPRWSSSRGGSEERYEADIVVVAAGASNSAGCSSARRTSAIPNGLANGSDQVGRNYMFHNSKAVVALAEGANDTVFQKTLGINDFYFATDQHPWPLGQHPDGRQVERLGDEGREAEADDARPALDPGRRRPARGRLLARPPRICPTPTTGSRSTATATSTSRTGRTTTRRRPASTTSSRRSSTTSAWPSTTCSRRTST